MSEKTWVFDLKAIPDRIPSNGVVPIVRITSTKHRDEITSLCRGITAAFEVNPPTHDTFVGCDPGTLYRVHLVAWFINDDGEQENVLGTPICTLKPKKPARTVVMVSVDDLGATVGCNDPNAIIVTDDGADTEAFDEAFKGMKKVVDPFNPGDRLFMI